MSKAAMDSGATMLPQARSLWSTHSWHFAEALAPWHPTMVVSFLTLVSRNLDGSRGFSTPPHSKCLSSLTSTREALLTPTALVLLVLRSTTSGSSFGLGMEVSSNCGHSHRRLSLTKRAQHRDLHASTRRTRIRHGTAPPSPSS